MEQNNTTIYSSAENYTEAINFIKKYKGLVCSIANKYKFHCYTDDELIAIGNEGLIEAKSRFNENFGVPFKTFAYRYIENAIKTAIDSITNVTTANNVYIRKINSFISSYYQENGEEPSLEEIKDYLNKEEGGKFSTADISTIMESKYCDSLDRELDDNGSLFDLVADTNESPIENYKKIEFNDYILNMMKTLTQNEYFIVSSKFGMFGSKQLDDKEISKILNISTSEVKIIYDKTVRKLQTSFRKLNNN